ncbi:hypothetical protein NDU88_012351, partial [Pleurodeles waltl]
VDSTISVINLSKMELTTSDISLLAKGLNFCPKTFGDPCKSKIDLFRFIRKLKIKRYFQMNQMENGAPVKTASPLSTLSIEEVQDTALILSLAEQDEDPDIFSRILNDLEVDFNKSISSGLKNKS